MLDEANSILTDYCLLYSKINAKKTPNNNIFRLQITYKATPVSDWGFMATITTQFDIRELHKASTQAKGLVLQTAVMRPFLSLQQKPESLFEFDLPPTRLAHWLILVTEEGAQNDVGLISMDFFLVGY